MLKACIALFYSELLLLLRRSHEWLYPLGFFLIIVCLFPICFSGNQQLLEKIMPAGIWMAALFANLLCMQNLFASDLEEGYLEQLQLSQISFSVIIFIKLCVAWLATQLPLILLLPILGLVFHLSILTISTLALSLFFGSITLTFLLALGVALTIGLRQQGVLLAILIFPLIIPILIFGIHIVQQAEAGFALNGPISFLAALTLFAITLLPFAIAYTLQIGLDE